ncbi:MAG: DUF2071 domain-containing protein [Puniceicoccales bacterium]
MLLQITDLNRGDEGVAELANAGGPFIRAAWRDALMLHFLVPAEELQAVTPFPLDLYAGWGAVTLVAFRMEDLQFVRWPYLPTWATAPAEHTFLNVRTYVREGGETGIHFLREYVPKLLARLVGPLTYGLPYRYATIDYQHDAKNRRFRGEIGRRIGIGFDAEYALEPAPTLPGTFDEFVLERYTAFNRWQGKNVLFRVAHPRWLMRRARLREFHDEALRGLFPFWEEARFVGGHFTPGFDAVQMGAPKLIQ